MNETESELTEIEPGADPLEAPAPTVCPACASPVLPGDQFCEDCGASLAPGAAIPAGADEVTEVIEVALPSGAPTAAGACADCGGVDFSDGYCDRCGRLAPDPRDHIEQDLGLVAGVTDRGLRHSRNEDAMALAVLGGPGHPRPAGVIVSCDGVSTSRDPHIASKLAAELIRDHLVAALGRGEPAEPAMAAALAAAQLAVADLAEDPDEPGNSSCATAVAAVVEPGLVTVGSVGDSRVYWLSRTAADSRVLTTDDSWAGLMIAEGILSEAEAFRSPQAHTIIRWLGADAPDEPAHVLQFVPEGPGLVLACSDGLWNYVPEAAKLAELAVPTETGAWGGLQAAANGLCAVALEGGGHDNITVTLAAYPPVAAEPFPGAAPAGTAALPRPPDGAQSNEEQPIVEGSGL
jgi:serine/threonine protein phosphatase PrpC